MFMPLDDTEAVYTKLNREPDEFSMIHEISLARLWPAIVSCWSIYEGVGSCQLFALQPSQGRITIPPCIITLNKSQLYFNLLKWMLKSFLSLTSSPSRQ